MGDFPEIKMGPDPAIMCINMKYLSGYLQQVQDEFYQNYQNGTWQLGEEVLYSALTVLVTAESLGTGAIMAALYPIFFHQISQSLPTGYNDINVSHNAGFVATKYGIYYNPLGYSYNYGFSFKDSYIFSFHQKNAICTGN